AALFPDISPRHSRIVRTDTGRSSESSWIPETESL
ncbi:phage recombination protein Bet, partial [Escherichia coli EC1846]